MSVKFHNDKLKSLYADGMYNAVVSVAAANLSLTMSNMESLNILLTSLLQLCGIIVTGLYCNNTTNRNVNISEISFSVVQLYIAMCQYDKPMEVSRTSFRSESHYADIYNTLGILLVSMNRDVDAEISYRQAINHNQYHVEAFNNLGNLLVKVQRFDEAESAYRTALNIKPNISTVAFNLGNLMRLCNRCAEAEAAYRNAITIQPNYADAYNNLASLLQGMKHYKDAEKCYRQALNIKNDSAVTINNFGSLLEETERCEEAESAYRQAIRLLPNFADAWYNLGNLLKTTSRYHEAEMAYRQSIRFRPNFAEAHNNLGIILQSFGQFNDAIASYFRALDVRPDFAHVYKNLSDCIDFQPGDPHIELIERKFSDPKLSESDRKYFCFALAKACEDAMDLEKSFFYLKEGNHLRRSELKYTIHPDRYHFERIKKYCDDNLAGLKRTCSECPTKKPIFIVGMPRSGTSLVEQILASHSEVHGAGELKIMGQLAGDIISRKSLQSPGDDVNLVHHGYLKALSELKIDKKIITDKMPLNFMYIIFIKFAFPESKIIHVQRDKRATCWSIFKSYFSDDGNGFAYDMNDIVEFYELYTDLMSFWQDLFPNSIYDLFYEQLTDNQEQETKKLLEYCDLKWEEQCLDFHRTERAVLTASFHQIRKPMYKDSSDAWKKYKAYLQEIHALYQ